MKGFGGIEFYFYVCNAIMGGFNLLVCGCEILMFYENKRLVWK